jgi:hypothetical protein
MQSASEITGWRVIGYTSNRAPVPYWAFDESDAKAMAATRERAKVQRKVDGSWIDVEGPK